MNHVDIGKRHLEALSANHWEAYKSYLAETAKYEELATRTSASGRDEYVEAVKRWKVAFPDLKARVLKAYGSGDVVVYEIEWSGTHNGPLDGPLGTIQPSGKFGTVRAAMVAHFANGKITEVHHYFDVMTILAQLGVLSGIAAQMGQTKPAEERVSTH